MLTEFEESVNFGMLVQHLRDCDDSLEWLRISYDVLLMQVFVFRTSAV
jgi:hypothetical protein